MSLALLRAEFTKLRTLRSVLAVLALVVLVSVGFGLLTGFGARAALDSNDPRLVRDFNPQEAGFDGILYGQVPMIVFGVLLVTGEYSSGMIGMSLLAVPRRTRFYLAKLTAGLCAAVAVAVPAAFLTVAATELALGKYGVSVMESGNPRTMASAVLYLTLMCLLAAGITVIARNALVPLAVLISLTMAGSQILSVIDATHGFARYLPDRAGGELIKVHHDSGDLGLAVGAAVMLAWTAAALLGGLACLCRRDV